MDFKKYRCKVTHPDGKVFIKDRIYRFIEDPGSRFELIDEDPVLGGIFSLTQDYDGTIYIGDKKVGYDDFSLQLARSSLGANDKPDYSFTKHGLLFPQNDTAEVAYLSDISSHRMHVSPGTMWFPHVHFLQATASLPIFEYRFRIHAAGEALPDLSAWIADEGVPVFTYSSGEIHQILSFPAINAYDSGFTGVACTIDVELRRNDNVITGDVVAKQFDFHAPFDSPLGSGQEFTK